jgi:asparagine synthase (glutamine-hydrolysing)
MCGIAAILGFAGDGADERAQVERMLAVLAHRGPDDAGLSSGDGYVIGMRRLAIQDLSAAGHQPMQRGDHEIVFNGEVYNFPELRDELAAAGFECTSGSDTEVVLQAFRAWGPEAFDRFDGMFALVIVDRVRGEAWIARDRFGKKPLFVARLGRRLVIASELKAVLAVAPGLTIDRGAVALYLRYQYVPGPRSIFAEVEKFPAASWARLSLADGSMSSAPRRFWRLPEDGGTAAGAEEVLDAVRTATRRRLIADVPVGVLLSGGTDSSLVTACVKEVWPDVRTFSIGFREPEYDESRYIDGVRAFLGTQHTHHVLSARDALDVLPQVVEAVDEPLADMATIPTYLISRLAHEQVTVVLTGDGGDELFGGYLRYRSGALLRRMDRLPRAAAPVLAAAGSMPGAGRRLAMAAAARRAGGASGAYREMMSIWTTPELSRLMPGAEPPDGFTAAYEAAPGGPVERMMRTDLATYLVDDLLAKVDRTSMAVSVEARCPLLDPAVVALAMRSTAIAEAGPGAKPLLRDALRLLLPDELVDRPKMGFAVPHDVWLRDELRPLVEDLVLSGPPVEYDRAEARRVFQQHLEGRRDVGHQMWCLVALELWRDRWVRAPAAAA